MLNTRQETAIIPPLINKIEQYDLIGRTISVIVLTGVPSGGMPPVTIDVILCNRH